MQQHDKNWRKAGFAIHCRLNNGAEFELLDDGSLTYHQGIVLAEDVMRAYNALHSTRPQEATPKAPSLWGPVCGSPWWSTARAKPSPATNCNARKRKSISPARPKPKPKPPASQR